MIASPMPKICPLISWRPGMTTANNRPNETAVNSTTTDSAPAIRFHPPGGPSQDKESPGAAATVVDGELAPDMQRPFPVAHGGNLRGSTAEIVSPIVSHRLRRADEFRRSSVRGVVPMAGSRCCQTETMTATGGHQELGPDVTDVLRHDRGLGLSIVGTNTDPATPTRPSSTGGLRSSRPWPTPTGCASCWPCTTAPGSMSAILPRRFR